MEGQMKVPVALLTWVLCAHIRGNPCAAWMYLACPLFQLAYHCENDIRSEEQLVSVSQNSAPASA